MKRIFLYAALCAAVITSCEKKEITPDLADNQVSFVINGPVTRVTTTGNVSIFQAGDQVSITSNGLYEDITNEVYTVGEAGLNGKTVYFAKDAAASFVAHYPATLKNENGAITMAVAADQDSDEDFHNNMFMVATAAGDNTTGSVSLAFAHKLAMVKVNIEGLDNAASVTISNIVPELTWSASALALSTTAQAIDIAAWKQPNKQEYWALVPAQTVAAQTKLITITDTEGKKYEYVLGSEIAFTTGKVKTINLTFKGSLVDAEFPALDNVTWDDEETPIEDVFDEVAPTPVSGITLDKTEAQMNIGATLTLTATVTPEDATDKTVVWTSSEETVATVVDGVVTAKAVGTAVITAKAGEFSTTCTVTVSEQVEIVPVDGVTLDKQAATVKVGKTLTLTATVTPENATDKTVTWTSNDETVATVADGVVTALKAGEAVITATAGEFSATCTVTVEGLLELISAETGDFSVLTEFASTPMNNYSGLTVNKWNIGSKASVEVENNEVAITIKDGTNARYNRGIGFRTGTIPSDVTTLTLSFNAYCSAEGQNLCVAAMQAEAANTAFKVDSKDLQTPTLNLTSTTYTYTIDLTSTVGADYTGGVILLLAPGNASNNLITENTWYVSNVRLIEKVSE